MATKRAGNISEEQKTVLADYMTRHPELRKGKFTQEFTYKQGQQLWEELTQELNQLNGGKKDWKSWRKTWQDQCSRTKQKVCAMNKSRRKTGGGEESSEKLSAFESAVTSLLGQVPIEGHPNIEESVVINFLDEETFVIEQPINHIPEFNDVMVETVETPRKNQTFFSTDHCYSCPTTDGINAKPNRTPLLEIRSPIRNQSFGTQTKEYQRLTNAMLKDTHHQASTSTNDCDTPQTEMVKENQKPVPEIKTPTPRHGIKRKFATQRLDHTINATEQLVAEMKEKNAIKREYYKKKIELLERQVTAVEEYYKQKLILLPK